MDGRIASVRWHRLGLLLALTGCAGGPDCTLIGCVSQLTVQLPEGTSEAQACVEGVCTSQIVDGTLLVPLGRRGGGDSAAVRVTLGSSSYEGEVPLTRTRPNGESCPPDCVNGEARVDLDSERIVPGRG